MFKEPIYWQVDPQSIIDQKSIASACLAAFRLYSDRRLLGTRLTKHSLLIRNSIENNNEKLFNCFQW